MSVDLLVEKCKELGGSPHIERGKRTLFLCNLDVNSISDRRIVEMRNAIIRNIPGEGEYAVSFTVRGRPSEPFGSLRITSEGGKIRERLTVRKRMTQSANIMDLMGISIVDREKAFNRVLDEALMRAGLRRDEVGVRFIPSYMEVQLWFESPKSVNDALEKARKVMREITGKGILEKL